MNQQQLQNARTALWRQDGRPLLTRDDAAAWLEETGLCLFLPRHAQLPAPAPSFVEACSGAGRAVPLPEAIRQAMELATGLVAEGRAIPLNLMANYTEQPDFLASPEALRWVASVRGDRQWKVAPGGRTSPIVLRVWEALDRERGRTALEICEELGRELTEAAVMRALVELWTTVRVAPEYAGGEPTRWTLLRDRFSKEMAAGANTAQTTALSALISLYLRQAVAATAEETEIFLSPLTARSRIREVLHGMLAARQFGTTAVGFHTVLFLEGSLPEAPAEEAAPPQPAETAAGAAPAPEKVRRPAERKPWKESSREPRLGPRREFAAGAKRPPARGGPPRREFAAGKRPGFPPKRNFSPGGEKPGSGKPWEKRGESRGPRREGWKPRGEGLGERREREQGFRRENREDGWQAPPRASGPPRPSGTSRLERPASPGRPFVPRREGSQEGSGGQRGAGQGEFRRKPWQPRPEREGFAARGGARERGAGRKPFSGKPKFDRPKFSRPGFSKPRFSRPGEDREKPRADRGEKPESGLARRPERTPAQRSDRGPARSRFGGARKTSADKSQSPRNARPAFRRDGERSGPGRSPRGGKPFGARPKFSRTGKPGEGGSGGDAAGGPGRGPARSSAAGRPAGPKGPGARFGKPAGRFSKPGGRFSKPGGGPFRKGGKPGSPRENKPQGPRSGKNLKERKDKPE